MPTAQVLRLYKDLDLAMTPLPNTGDVGRRLDISAVKQALKNLLLTRYFERPFQPQLGSPLYQLLFEPLDAITAASIQQAIERVIQNYEPRVQIQYIAVAPNEDLNAYNVTIYFNIVGLRDPVTFSTTLTRLR